MNLENYTVAVRLSLVENVSKGLVSLAGRFSVLNAQATLFQSKLAALKSQIAIGAAMLGGAAAIASPFIYATLQAGKLQQQLKAVQLATGATNEQMEQFRRTVDKVASGSIFKNIDIATMAKTLATANTFSAAQVEQLLPQFAKFATTQFLLKGTPVAKSTEQAIQLAEITGHFTPDAIKGTLDAFTKLSLLMPGSVDKVLSAFKYAEGTMKNVMGVSDESTLLMVAMLQRMGIQGTRAGTQMLALISRTIPQVFGSGLWTGQSQQMLAKMGMLNAQGVPDVFTNGKFDPLKFFNKLGQYITNEFKTHPENVARADIMKSLQMTFGTTGTRIASIVSTPEAIKQFQELQKAFSRFPNLDAIADKMDDLFNKQFPQAMSNISTLFTSLGYALLPTADKGLKGFNDQIKRLIDYIDTHQETVARFEKAILVLTGAMVIGGLFLMMRAAIIGLFIPLQMLTIALTTLFPALSGAILGLSIPGLLVVAAIAAVGIAIYEVCAHWDLLIKKIKEWDAYLSNFAVYNYAKAGIKMVWNAFTSPIQLAITGFKYLFNVMENGLNWLIRHVKDITSFATRIKNDTVYTVKHPITTIEHALSSWSPISAIKHPITTIGNLLGVGSLTNLAANAIPLINSPSIKMHNAPLPNAGHGVMPNAGIHNGANNQSQPIHVHVHVDGQKVASAVVNHVYKQATQVPSTGSVFDSRLSPVPTILNNMGY